jgi:hypothetical protein
MRYVALAVVLLSGTAAGQTDPTVVCPLSEMQVHDSIAAFAKIVPILTTEPRCVNCHGGVDITAAESPHPDVSLPTETEEGSTCTDCHDKMAPRTNGMPSEWSLAPAFLGFVNKSDTQLCEQIKEFSNGPCSGGSCYRWPSAEKFVAHVTDDEGRDNFTATAFAGTRGLDLIAFDEVALQPPANITHAQLIGLGKDWVQTTGGEWQGKEDCGCDPSSYALRLKIVTVISAVNFRNEMGPLDIPLEFKDDGTFTGEGDLRSQGFGAFGDCTLTGSGGLRLAASGKAVQKWNEQYLRVELKPAGQTTMAGSARCPDIGAARQFAGMSNETLTVELKGEVGEVASLPMPSPDPSVTNSVTVEIVKRD